MVRVVREATETTGQYQRRTLSKEAYIEAVRQGVSPRSPAGDGMVQKLREQQHRDPFMAREQTPGSDQMTTRRCPHGCLNGIGLEAAGQDQ